MGYGMGGKTFPKQIRASDVFSLSGDMFDPTISYSSLIEKYIEITKSIDLSLPAKMKPMLELIQRYAKHEYENHKGRNYYSVFFISPGVIDDIEETVELLIEIASLPLTVTIIKLNNPVYQDTDDAQTLLQKYLSSKAPEKRQALFVINYENFQQTQDLKAFEHQLFLNLPEHVGEYYDSRRSKDFTKKSISQHKTFADEFDNNLDLTVSSIDEESEEEKEEEEEGEEQEEEKTHHKRERFKSVFIHNPPTIRKRKLSYGDTCEELFVATFPVTDDISKQELEQMVADGAIMDESPEYVEYINKKRKKQLKTQKSI